MFGDALTTLDHAEYLDKLSLSDLILKVYSTSKPPVSSNSCELMAAEFVVEDIAHPPLSSMKKNTA